MAGIVELSAFLKPIFFVATVELILICNTHGESELVFRALYGWQVVWNIWSDNRGVTEYSSTWAYGAGTGGMLNR